LIFRIVNLLLALSFLLIQSVFAQSSLRGVSVSSSLSNLDNWGNYYALIIGINDYKEWPRLQTAVKDATVIRDTLVSRYGFEKENVILRTDRSASRLQITEDLRYLAQSMGKNDNLLVYYAGHGQLDDFTGDGYWVPAEGALKNPSTWVANSYVKAILSSEKLQAKNVMVIADSCYSGAMLRGGSGPMALNDRRYTEKLAEKATLRSRQVISSGGIEPVVDGGAEGHSLFAFYLIDALRKNDREVIDLENLLHTRVWKPVSEIGGQRPTTGRLRTPMDQDGQFVLYNAAWVKQKAALEAKKQKQARQKQAVVSAELELQRQRLEMEQQKLALEKERLAQQKALELERIKQQQAIEMERVKLEKQKQEMEYAKLQARLEEMKMKGVVVGKTNAQPTLASVSPAIMEHKNSMNDSLAQSRYKLVLFPARVTATRGQGAKQFIEEKIVKGIADVTHYDLKLDWAYTYKNLENLPNQANLLTSILKEENTQVWKQASIFSSAKPDWEKVKNIGTITGANIGVLVNMKSDGPQGVAGIYVYDFKREKIYSKLSHVCQKHGFDSEVNHVTRRLLRKFYKGER